MMYGYYGDWGHPFFGWLMMIFFWVVPIIIIAWIMHGRWHNDPKGKALDILKERYAKGEINKEEFETEKKDLT